MICACTDRVRLERVTQIRRRLLQHASILRLEPGEIGGELGVRGGVGDGEAELLELRLEVPHTEAVRKGHEDLREAPR